MKLLKKNEINTVKALERRVEINEGAKLAKKVDELRQTHSKEQSNLIKFRNESVKKVKEEVNKAFEEKTSLEKEIKTLEKKKIKLLIPLDKERKEIDDKKEELTKFAQELNDKHVVIEQEKKEIDIEKTFIDQEKQRIHVERETSIRNLADSSDKEEKARKTLIKADEIYARTAKELSEKEEILIKREEIIASSERDIKLKNDYIQNEYKFISGEKMRLADQRATLERAMARITRIKQ